MEDQAAFHRIIKELEPLVNPLTPSEELAQAQAEHRAAERQYSDEVDPVRKRALFRETGRCLDHLENIERQEKAKKEQLEEQLHRFLLKRHGGSTPAVQQRSEQPNEDATLATPDTTTAGINNDRAMNPATQSPIGFENPVEDAVRGENQSTEPPRDIIQAPDIRGTTVPTTERTHTPFNVDEQNRVEQTGEPSTSNKRRANTSASRRTKQKRPAIATGPLTKNTILFNEVYGDGQVNRRSRIMERDGRYYIFKCKKHDKFFDAKDPLQSATSHLKSHGKLRSTHDNAFKYLGFQVLQCTEAGCADNNRAVDRYLEEQEHKRERRKASTYNLVQYPQTGHMYMAWWEVNGEVMLHALLVIAFSEPCFGVDTCVKNSELGDDIPACYDSNGHWTEGYEDGGKFVKNRVYPIMCFDENNPHLVDWLPMCQFRRLNVDDEHLDYAQDVMDYIVTEFCGAGPAEDIGNESDDLYDDSRNGDGDGPTSTGHTQTHVEAVNPAEGDGDGTAAEIPSQLQRDVKVENSTQPSGRDQLWPVARRNPPAMESLDLSDSSDSSDFNDFSD